MGNYNKEAVVKKIVSSILFIFTFFQIHINVKAFDGATHEYVTQMSLDTFSKLETQGKSFYDEKAEELIMEYCTKPDIDENDGVFKDHFYNIATQRNFMGEKMSALVKFRQHYRNALINYKKGRMAKCWEELGRAIHFLEDINTPVHGGYDRPTDAMKRLPMHVAFEKTCILVQDECLADININELQYYLDNTLDDIAKTCARKSNDNYFALKNGYIAEEEIAKRTIIDAQRAVVGILFRFTVDTGTVN